MRAGQKYLTHPVQHLAAWRLRRAVHRVIALEATGEIGSWSAWHESDPETVIAKGHNFVIRLPDVDAGIILGPDFYGPLAVNF
jgi:hypothetical protein